MPDPASSASSQSHIFSHFRSLPLQLGGRILVPDPSSVKQPPSHTFNMSLAERSRSSGPQRAQSSHSPDSLSHLGTDSVPAPPLFGNKSARQHAQPAALDVASIVDAVVQRVLNPLSDLLQRTSAEAESRVLHKIRKARTQVEELARSIEACKPHLEHPRSTTVPETASIATGPAFLPKVKDLPRFSGRPCDDVDEWLQHVTVIYDHVNADTSRLVQSLPRLLTGYALDWFCRLPRAHRQALTTWSDWSAELRTAFRIANYDSVMRIRLRMHEWQPGQSLASYFSSRQKLQFAVFGDDASEQSLQLDMLSGLPVMAQGLIKGCLARSDASLTDLRRVMLDLEPSLVAMHASHRTGVSDKSQRRHWTPRRPQRLELSPNASAYDADAPPHQHFGNPSCNRSSTSVDAPHLPSRAKGRYRVQGQSTARQVRQRPRQAHQDRADTWDSRSEASETAYDDHSGYDYVESYMTETAPVSSRSGRLVRVNGAPLRQPIIYDDSSSSDSSDDEPQRRSGRSPSPASSDELHKGCSASVDASDSENGSIYTNSSGSAQSHDGRTTDDEAEYYNDSEDGQSVYSEVGSNTSEMAPDAPSSRSGSYTTANRERRSASVLNSDDSNGYISDNASDENWSSARGSQGGDSSDGRSGTEHDGQSTGSQSDS